MQHSYKRIESLECGRTGKFICKIDRLGTIFANSRIFSSHKHAGRAIDENSPCDFCSHLFFTSPHGFSMYLRPFTFGSDIGEGKFVSIYLASSARNFAGTLPWPFPSIIEVRCINQNEPAWKWKKTVASKHNITCFQRPTSKSSSVSVGLVQFMSHKFVQYLFTVFAWNEFFVEQHLKMRVFSQI